MTTPKDPLPKVPPFVERETQPRRNSVDMRGLLSLALLLVSMGALTVAMGGAAKLVFDIFTNGLENSLNGIWAKVIVLGLAYLFGWAVGLFSIRGFGNLIYPIVIKIYAWVCLLAVGILYLKIIQKLYDQQYDNLRLWAYLFMLLGGIVALIGLHLLVEGHDLRPLAVPLLILSVLQLFVFVYRYVFTDADERYLGGDLLIFIAMISISMLMLMHVGILAPLRDRIDGIFKHNGNGNGNGKDNEHHWVG
jgi:hypothetical protein